MCAVSGNRKSNKGGEILKKAKGDLITKHNIIIKEGKNEKEPVFIYLFGHGFRPSN